MDQGAAENTRGDKGKEKQVQAMPEPRDAFIIVMGATGTGKTTFVNLCSGADSLEVGHGLRSCTQSIAEAIFDHNGRKVHLIDTPGFDDTTRSDVDILMEVAFFLATTYNNETKMDGIIYLHRIMDVRMGGSAIKNLRMFAKLIGEEALSKVVLATSMWNEVLKKEYAENREKELRLNFWNDLVDKGSNIYRLDGHKDSALRVLDALLPGEGNQGKVLQIQRELVDEFRSLDETNAGQELLDSTQKQREQFQEDLESMKTEMGTTMAKSDAKLARELRHEEVVVQMRLSDIENDRERLRMNFRELLRDRDEQITSLTRQLEMEREDQALHMEKVNSELDRLRTKIQYHENIRVVDSRVVTETPNEGNSEESKIRQLEEELAKSRREVAEKHARMGDLRNFMLYRLKGYAAGPPPPYKESAPPMEKSPTELKAQDVFEDSDVSQGLSSDELDNQDGLKSPLARKQNRSSAAASLRHKPRESTNQMSSRRIQPNRRASYEARRQIQEDLYQHSLHSFVDYSRTSLSYQSSSRLANLGLDPTISNLKVDGVPASKERNYQDRLKRQVQSSEKPSGPRGDWLFAELLMCRNMALTVYANCRRLQSTGLAGEFFSLLALAPHSRRAQPAVLLRRVFIEDVLNLVRLLAECTDKVRDPDYGPLQIDDLPSLSGSLSRVHRICIQLLDLIGFDNYMTTLTGEQLYNLVKPPLNEPFEVARGLAPIFCEWRCVCQVLDIGILAYEGAHVADTHVADVHGKILADKAEAFQFPQPSLSLPGTHSLAQKANRIQYRRLKLRCLSAFLEDREVWVFDDTMEQYVPPLYLATDIETFADVWGPVWKVADLTHPGSIAKYNVGGGSILPWRFDASIHPKLKAGERLCHWTSNTDYIRGNNPSSPNLSSSSSTSSEAEEAPADEPVLESFTGLEMLVIGADQNPRLQWNACKCPVDNLKQHLKNAGRLDHIIASKSYRYVDSQQNSLVVGSHGVQAGQSRTWKDKREEPLKKSLLDVWENEADSRDPREFENFWGVAVSLCTMNAQRVRLVELLGEESMFALLRHFPWSDLSQDGTRSKIRKRYLKAVRSDDPLALGDLWDRHPSWRKELGNAILVCLRILFRTGYDENRDEFHMLWLPPRCRAPRRVTLKPTDQSWVKFLKDTTYSMTVAVVVEDSLGSQHRCSGNRPRWFKTPSILETAICINSTLDPTPKLIRTRGCHDENHYITRRDFEEWQSTWDVSAIEPGVHLWMRSQTRIRAICPLTKWHLLLEVDTVKRLIFREMIGMRPREQIGHWEYTDEELEGNDVRPIPVHITS